MVEMKIRDEELNDFALHISKAGQVLNDRIESLKNCLENVCINGVSEGDFHNNLELYVSLLETLISQIDYKTSACTAKIATYELSLDYLDGNLY